MDTFFAPAERADEDELNGYVRLVSENTLVGGLMQVVGGLLAVLNEQRQILAVNHGLLDALGLGDARDILGLRLGEAIECVHAHEGPAGCGTTEFCSSCGAAIAMVTSLDENRPADQTCAVTVKRGEISSDLFLLVQCRPVELEGRRVLLLFLRDITMEKRRASLERVFFHDISNTVNCILNASELLLAEDGTGDITQRVFQCALRLAREISIQKSLVRNGDERYETKADRFRPDEIVEAIQADFSAHPAAENKDLRVLGDIPEVTIEVDRHLVYRVLDNMVTNALEATDEGDEVRIRVTRDEGGIAFSVWNRRPVEDTVRKRVFQRNISTKEGLGRGLGTYSMKLFGEDYLGGKVDFSTSETEGTVFRFYLPL